MGRRFSRRKLVVAGVTLLVVAGLAGAVAMRVAKKSGDSGGPDKAPAVALEFAPADLSTVESMALARWLPISGTVQPVRQATVKSKVSGEVRKISIREGESVEAGQMLVTVDTADLDAKLLERQGQLESARAQLALAEKNNATNQKLLLENFISKNASDSAESTLAVSKGTVKSAEAQVRMAQNALKDSTATAPLSGVVGKRHVQPGEKVAFDAPLVTVVDLTEMELQALVPAVDIPELKLGMTVQLNVDGFGERKFAGRIERINPATEPGTRAILVFVSIPNANGELRGGMFATGRIAMLSGEPVATLPATAVRTEAGQSYVWAIDDDKLVRRIVVTGRRDDEAGRIEIKTALPPKLQILASRFENLKEGAKALVKVSTPSAPKQG